MAVELATADVYFSEFVLNNDAWVNSDNDSKQRALNNASNILSRHYRNRVLPDEAVFEQAIWLLKITEARKQSEQGVVSYSVDGISVTLSQVDRTIAQPVLQMMGRRVGTSQSGRQGWVVSNDKYINQRLGRDIL